MDRAGNLLTHILRKRGLKEHADASLALHQSRLWLNEQLPLLKDALTPTALLTDGTLILEAANSAAAQECQQVTAHLLHHLREEYGHIPVRSIRVMRSRTPPRESAESR